MPATTACKEAEVASKTSIDAHQRLTQFCSTKLIANPIKLGGPCAVIQVDESLFNHKLKVHKSLLDMISVQFNRV